ncbi:MAG: endonuclease [Sphingomonas bacterium]|jgi:putative endonuclease|nr:endonuclease [Sphingomonas bacterium]
MKSGCVYIMASKRNGTIYTGVTSNLPARIYQHRNGLVDGFTKEHRCILLVWYEAHDDLQEARLRELQIKRWKRAWKIELIERDNPLWRICTTRCSSSSVLLRKQEPRASGRIARDSGLLLSQEHCSLQYPASLPRVVGA